MKVALALARNLLNEFSFDLIWFDLISWQIDYENKTLKSNQTNKTHKWNENKRKKRKNIEISCKWNVNKSKKKGKYKKNSYGSSRTPWTSVLVTKTPRALTPFCFSSFTCWYGLSQNTWNLARRICWIFVQFYWICFPSFFLYLVVDFFLERRDLKKETLIDLDLAHETSCS